MKNIRLSIVLFVIVFLSIGCGNLLPKEVNTIAEEVSSTIEPISEESLDAYTYQEEKFRERYEEALKAIKNGSKPNTNAPIDSTQNKFAIIPLEIETYGIDSFAVLPIIERDLTEEEMLQLEEGMGGISFEKLLDSKHAWMDVKNQQTENRLYYWEERIRAYELDEQYRYDSIRPKQQVSLNEASSKGPLCITIPEAEYSTVTKYKMYPLSTMTDEQLLQMIAIKYPVEDIYLKPIEGEIPYKQVAGVVSKMVGEYSISEEEPQNIYASYNSSRYSTENGGNLQLAAPETAAWVVSLHFSKGYDYQITFNAKNGTFQNWVRYPIGYFAKKEPKDFIPAVTPVSKSEDMKQIAEHTIKEMQGAAETYVLDKVISDKNKSSILSNDLLSDFTSYPVYGLRIEGEGIVVNITLSTGKVYQVAVMKADLSIQGVRVIEQIS